WSTMYLSHHYFVDLVAGSLISATAFFIVKSHSLPRIQPGKLFRWDYDYVERGDDADDLALDEAEYHNPYMLSDLDEYSPNPTTAPAHHHRHGDSDEWTLGSSSSYSSSASREPSTGMRSPVTGDEWDGDTLASASDTEGFHKI
ncbi:hypothetical protein KC331_g21654, partial [Hortaea werneckii]